MCRPRNARERAEKAGPSLHIDARRTSFGRASDLLVLSEGHRNLEHGVFQPSGPSVWADWVNYITVRHLISCLATLCHRSQHVRRHTRLNSRCQSGCQNLIDGGGDRSAGGRHDEWSPIRARRGEHTAETSTVPPGSQKDVATDRNHEDKCTSRISMERERTDSTDSTNTLKDQWLRRYCRVVDSHELDRLSRNIEVDEPVVGEEIVAGTIVETAQVLFLSVLQNGRV